MERFPFKKVLGATLIDPEVSRAMKAGRDALPDGEYEYVCRKVPKWDTDQMRKYFHALCKKFFKPMFKQKGHPYGEREIKEYFKHKYGDMDDMDMPISTSEYDFDRYHAFLNDIADWTRDNWGEELPLKNEIEKDEIE